MTKRNVILAVLISVLISCSEKDPTIPFTVDPVAVETVSSGNNVTVTISSPVSWRATSSESWCRIVPSSGSATSSIGTDLTLTLDENNGLERGCLVEFVSDVGERASIQVFQNHSGDGVVLDKDTYRISGETTHLEIPFRCGPPVVNIDDNWISLERIGSDKIELSIERYDSLLNRTGNLRLSAPDGNPVNIQIIQGDGFSDPSFYRYMLEHYDRNMDGNLSKQDLESVRTLTIELEYYERPITILDGFGCIPNMEVLRILQEYVHYSNLDLKLTDHPSIERIELGPWLPSSITSIEVTGCPSLRSVDFNDGEKLERAIIRDNPSLEDLILVNGYFGANCSTLKHLVVEGCDNIKNLKVQLATFEEGMSLEPLPNLRSVDFQLIDGIRGLDFSQSPQLESVTVYPYRYGSGMFKFVLVPKSIASRAKTDIPDGVSILYK